jgi:hypothetical protein
MKYVLFHSHFTMIFSSLCYTYVILTSPHLTSLSFLLHFTALFDDFYKIFTSPNLSLTSFLKIIWFTGESP